jgi:hypothetical protein
VVKTFSVKAPARWGELFQLECLQLSRLISVACRKKFCWVKMKLLWTDAYIQWYFPQNYDVWNYLLIDLLILWQRETVASFSFTQLHVSTSRIWEQTKTLRGFSPQVNSTDRTTSACRRS